MKHLHIVYRELPHGYDGLVNSCYGSVQILTAIVATSSVIAEGIRITHVCSYSTLINIWKNNGEENHQQFIHQRTIGNYLHK